MHTYSLSHVSDAVLLRDLAVLVARDRLTTAEILAHIAEVDARQLYVPVGYSSMHAYCVEELRLSEDAASKRIQAARAARRFPELFEVLAEGRVHLTGVCILAPHLTPENARELIEAAMHRKKSEIEEMLARRFPWREERVVVRAVAAVAAGDEILALRSDGEHALAHVGNGSLAPACPDEHAPAHVDASEEGTLPTPVRYLLKLTIAKSTHDKLRYAQALLSHAVPSGDVGQVLDRALDTLIAQLEKRKFGAIARERARRNGQGSHPRRTSTRVRHVPAHIRRAVWERDQGQCTFVGASGHRCNTRRFLQFDHVDPVARGGSATVEGMRLRCRAHNQYEAERAFGANFMSQKRREARLAAAQARASATAARMVELAAAGTPVPAAVERRAETRGRTAEMETTKDLIAGLRSLGFRADEARRAAEFSSPTGATLEERMRAALQILGRRSIRAQSCASRG